MQAVHAKYELILIGGDVYEESFSSLEAAMNEAFEQELCVVSVTCNGVNATNKAAPLFLSIVRDALVKDALGRASTAYEANEELASAVDDVIYHRQIYSHIHLDFCKAMFPHNPEAFIANFLNKADLDDCDFRSDYEQHNTRWAA